MATECIQNFSTLNPDSLGMSTISSMIRPACIKSDSSRFVISMSNRQSYMSTVAALLSQCETSEKKLELFAKFCAQLDKAAEKVKTVSDDVDLERKEQMKFGGKFTKVESELEKMSRDFHETIWKITASIILMKPAVDEKLIFALTRAPLKIFSAHTMKIIVECWNWLLSARPDIEMKFLQEMIFSWHASQTAQLGLFKIEENK